MADSTGDRGEPLANPLTASPAQDRAVLDRLFDSSYEELRRIAHRRLFSTPAVTSLHTTVLVHECYLRLAKLGGFQTDDRAYLLSYAARAMRSIIVDLLRARGAVRNGGAALHVTLDPDYEPAAPASDQQILRVNEALEELDTIDTRLARVVEMRYFAGLEFAEIGQALGMNERTAQRDWQKARLWLDAALRE
jgi:RNA polymerase sigma factor (TIGR02999 family)